MTGCPLERKIRKLLYRMPHSYEACFTGRHVQPCRKLGKVLRRKDKITKQEPSKNRSSPETASEVSLPRCFQKDAVGKEQIPRTEAVTPTD